MELVLTNLSCGAVVLVVMFAMFSLGWIGGGDAKLAAATALWLGWSSLLDYSLSAAIYGGALTFLLIFARKAPLPDWLSRQAWIARLHNPKTGVPYGIALAAAGIMVYPQTALWRALAVALSAYRGPIKRLQTFSSCSGNRWIRLINRNLTISPA